MRNFIGVVAAQEWHDVVGFGFWWQKAVFVLPFVRVHSENKWLISNHCLFFLFLQSFNLFLVEEIVITIWHPLIILKQSTSSKLLHTRSVRLSEVDVGVLLFSCILQHLIWSHMVWQLPQSIVIACSETSLDKVTLFVCIIIKYYKKMMMCFITYIMSNLEVRNVK